MAGPFIPLGLKAIDYVADNHLHKLDDKYFHYSNYKPQNLATVVPNPLSPLKKNKKKKKSKSTAGQDGSGDEEDEDSFVEDREERYGSIPKESGLGRETMTRPPPGTDIEYSHQPPRVRDRYVPPSALAASAGVNAPYFPPPPSYSNGDTYETPISRQRRPRVVSRRSSSHPGHGRRGRYYDSGDSESGSEDSREMRKRKSKYFGSEATGLAPVDRARERAHRYGVKDDIKGSFTDSKAGLAGSAVGAVVGGWAASKAQVAFDKKGRSEPNALLTLLGAAVGGLAANVAVDRFEDNKKDTKEKQNSWEDKFNNDGDPRTGNRSVRGSGGDTRRSRRRKDRGYDSGYD